MIPEPFAFLLLVLAAFRTWKLLYDDVITDRPRDWLHSRLGIESPRAAFWLIHFAGCPWCLGFWTSLGWFLVWLALPTPTLVVAVPFAISALVGLVGVRADPE